MTMSFIANAPGPRPRGPLHCPTRVLLISPPLRAIALHHSLRDDLRDVVCRLRAGLDPAYFSAANGGPDRRVHRFGRDPLAKMLQEQRQRADRRDRARDALSCVLR